MEQDAPNASAHGVDDTNMNLLTVQLSTFLSLYNVEIPVPTRNANVIPRSEIY